MFDRKLSLALTCRWQFGDASLRGLLSPSDKPCCSYTAPEIQPAPCVRTAFAEFGLSEKTVPVTTSECALLTFSARPVSIHAEVHVPPAGLLAIAALVSAILLSTAMVVQAAKH